MLVFKKEKFIEDTIKKLGDESSENLKLKIEKYFNWIQRCDGLQMDRDTCLITSENGETFLGDTDWCEEVKENVSVQKE